MRVTTAWRYSVKKKKQLTAKGNLDILTKGNREILDGWAQRSVEEQRKALSVVLSQVVLYPNYIHLFFRPRVTNQAAQPPGSTMHGNDASDGFLGTSTTNLYHEPSGPP